MNSDLVRLRIYETLGKYLQLLNLNSNGQLEDKIFVRMQIVCMDGIRDTSLSVQKAAIKTSSLLQVPKDKYCPIINSFIKILLHDSDTEIRLCVLDLIAINNLTFDLIKNQLIYDSDQEIQNKVLCIIQEKVPCKFFDANFKKIIITCLLKNKNTELTKKFILKWLQESKPGRCLNFCEKNFQFIKSLDLKNFWYIEENYEYILYSDENLFNLMSFVYELFLDTKNLSKFLNDLSQFLSDKVSFLNLDICFFIRSLLYFCKLNDLCKVKDFLGLRLDDYFKNVVIPKQDFLETHFSINIIFELTESNISILARFIELIEYSDEKSSCLFQTILARFDTKIQLEFIWNLFLECVLSEDKIKKFLSLFSIVLAHMNIEDFNEADNLNLNLDLFDRLEIDLDIDLNQNVIEYLIENFVVKKFSDLDPKTRALCARALGHASLLNINIARNYFHIYNQVIYN